MNKQIEELFNKVEWQDGIINRQIIKINDLQEKIDKVIEYTKTILKFARLEKDFEKEKILLNFLEILGDKE